MMLSRLFFLVISLIPVIAIAQQSPVPSGVYPWPGESLSGKKYSSTLLSGSGHDLEFVEVSANVISPKQKRKFTVPENEEHLLLIVSGSLSATVNDSTYSLDKGSMAMIMPSGKYLISNASVAGASYHIMKYRSKLPVDQVRGKSAGGSFIKDWNKLTFKPAEKGGTRAYFDRPTAMARRFEIHVTTLKEGFISHPAHTHESEEIILVLQGNVDMLIGEKSYKAKAGDLLYVNSNVLHGLKNDGTGECSYYAIQWN
jgi:(S)-ureidoglycine aminohydrolase